MRPLVLFVAVAIAAAGPKTLPVAVPFWSQDVFWNAVIAVVAVLGLGITASRLLMRARNERQKCQNEKREADRAKIEANMRPSWSISFDPDDFERNHFVVKPTQPLGNGCVVEVKVFVKNTGQRPSGTFQVELYFPHEVVLHTQKNGLGSLIKTQQNISPFPGMRTWAIRFRCRDENFKPDEQTRLGSFALFYALNERTTRDYKLYWRVTSQENGYDFPPGGYGQIGLQIEFTEGQ
jgi:hypothetical protein